MYGQLELISNSLQIVLFKEELLIKNYIKDPITCAVNKPYELVASLRLVSVVLGSGRNLSDDMHTSQTPCEIIWSDSADLGG